MKRCLGCVLKRYRWCLSASLLAVGWVSCAVASEDRAHEVAAKKWLENEFNVSTLSPAQQMEEVRWFAAAAKPFRGMTVRVVSERIDTHVYESNVLARAFSEITGINVVHELTGEDDVIKKLQTQIQTGVNLYDA